MILRCDFLRLNYLLVKLKLPCYKMDCFDLTRKKPLNEFMQSETEKKDVL